MKVFVNIENERKQFMLQPEFVSAPMTSTVGSKLMHSVKTRAKGYLVLTITRSRKASKWFAGMIFYGAAPNVFLNEKCLALGVLCHPVGWPESQYPVSHFARVHNRKMVPSGVHVPNNAGEVFTPAKECWFSIVDPIPDAPYQLIRYDDITDVWLKGNRVGMKIRAACNPALLRIVVVTDSLNSAYRLAASVSKREVKLLRVNATTRAIIQEVRTAEQETRYQVAGMGNLTAVQRRTIAELGGSHTQTFCFLTKPLHWEHARMVAAVQLF